MSDTRTIGPFVVGEKPAPLQYQFLDSSGVPLNLTGYTAVFVYREHDGTGTNVAATVLTPSSGIVQYIWTGIEFPTAGHYSCEFWVGNSTNRFASLLIYFTVHLQLNTVPSI